MKIIITGGLGFIGSALADQLLQAGHAVVLIDSLIAQVHGEAPSPRIPVGADVVRLDVRELPQCSEIIDGADAICHFAAETGTGQSMHQMVHYVQVNDAGTAAVLEAMARCRRRPRHVVLSSSRSVYGEGAYVDPNKPGLIIQPKARTLDDLAQGRWDHSTEAGRLLKSVATPETLMPCPGSIYAATKIAQEMLVMAAANALGVRATVLRFQNVYGEGQSLRNPYTGIISIFYNRVRQGLPIPIYEDGQESRDFVHVADVVRAIALALNAPLPEFSVLNVGSGAPTPVAGLAQQLLAVSKLNAAIEITGQYRVGDIRHCFADISEASRLLGWRPLISLEEGLHRFIQWAATEPIHEDRLDLATGELKRLGLAAQTSPQVPVRR